MNINACVCACVCMFMANVNCMNFHAVEMTGKLMHIKYLTMDLKKSLHSHHGIRLPSLQIVLIFQFIANKRFFYLLYTYFVDCLRVI